MSIYNEKVEFNNKYLRRALELGHLAGKHVQGNPQVGAVLVSNRKIIGEGWHKKYQTDHAEIAALKSVQKQDYELIQKATMYVTLEPCAHYGHSGPCAEAIVKAKIPRVVIGKIDPTSKVNGKGIQILKQAGLDVRIEENFDQSSTLTDHFLINDTFNRPKILLKFAQSIDGFLGKENESIWLTNSFSKRLVHKYRSTYGAIMVGTNTVLQDNPSLNTRYHFGPNPIRIVPDFQGRITEQFNVFQDGDPTWILSYKPHPLKGISTAVRFIELDPKRDFYGQLFEELVKNGIHKLIVEGGAKLLNNFVSEQYWDEALIFTTQNKLETGIKSPILPDVTLSDEIQLCISGDPKTADNVQLIQNQNPN